VKDELKAAAAGLTLVVFVAHAWVSVTSGAGLNLVSGVWLALARDGQDGIFYRGLLSDAGYGGTRYFPLFFTLIAALMRAGAGALAAGYASSLAGAAILAGGAFACTRRLGLSQTDASLVASLTLAPYFVQQGVFGIRTEPLAAGLALFGAAFTLPRDDEGRGAWQRALVAAVFFTAAVAAKPTVIYAPSAAALALLFARHRREAGLVLVFTAAGVALLAASIAIVSDGRAIEAFRVGALGGQSAAGLFATATLTRPLGLVMSSRLLTVIFALALLALVTDRDGWRRLPALLVLTTAVVMTIVLASPGTILTNQVVELYVAALLLLGWVMHARPAWKFLGSAALVLLAAWMAAQNVTRITTLMRTNARSVMPAERQSLVHAYSGCRPPVLAESPLVPLLAGDRPILLDPFAFRVVALQRAEIGAHLVARIRAREFSCVILEHDPLTPQGEGWYRNVHFGWPVIEAVLEQYTYRGSVAGRHFYGGR
jgi:hypothetical protein